MVNNHAFHGTKTILPSRIKKISWENYFIQNAVKVEGQCYPAGDQTLTLSCIFLEKSRERVIVCVLLE